MKGNVEEAVGAKKERIQAKKVREDELSVRERERARERSGKEKKILRYLQERSSFY